MTGNPFDIIKSFDPEAVEDYMATENKCFKDGALSKKTKMLMALAIDTILDAPGGVRTLTQRLLKEGTTWDELKEAFEVIRFTGKAGPMWTIIHGLEDIVKTD